MLDTDCLSGFISLVQNKTRQGQYVLPCADVNGTKPNDLNDVSRSVNT